MKNFTVFWKITQAEGIDEPEKIVYDLPSRFDQILAELLCKIPFHEVVTDEYSGKTER